MTSSRPRERTDRLSGVPFLRGFLRVPLFYKILLANSVIVVLGAVGGTTLARHLLRPGADEVSPPLFVILLALAAGFATPLVRGRLRSS